MRTKITPIQADAMANYKYAQIRQRKHAIQVACTLAAMFVAIPFVLPMFGPDVPGWLGWCLAAVAFVVGGASVVMYRFALRAWKRNLSAVGVTDEMLRTAQPSAR
jgi:hypothetical protein